MEKEFTKESLIKNPFQDRLGNEQQLGLERFLDKFHQPGIPSHTIITDPEYSVYLWFHNAIGNLIDCPYITGNYVSRLYETSVVFDSANAPFGSRNGIEGVKDARLRPKCVDLSPFVREAQLPEIQPAGAEKIKTLFGETTAGSFSPYASDGQRSIVLSMLDTEYSILDAIFYPWMKDINSPWWYRPDRIFTEWATPYPMATLEVKRPRMRYRLGNKKVESRKDAEYINYSYKFIGVKPTNYAAFEVNALGRSSLLRTLTLVADMCIVDLTNDIQNRDLAAVKQQKKKLFKSADIPKQQADTGGEANGDKETDENKRAQEEMAKIAEEQKKNDEKKEEVKEEEKKQEGGEVPGKTQPEVDDRLKEKKTGYSLTPATPGAGPDAQPDSTVPNHFWERGVTVGQPLKLNIKKIEILKNGNERTTARAPAAVTPLDLAELNDGGKYPKLYMKLKQKDGNAGWYLVDYSPSGNYLLDIKSNGQVLTDESLAELGRGEGRSLKKVKHADPWERNKDNQQIYIKYWDSTNDGVRSVREKPSSSFLDGYGIQRVLETLQSIGSKVANDSLSNAAWVADGIQLGSGLDVQVGDVSYAVGMDNLKSSKLPNACVLDGLGDVKEFNQIEVPDVDYIDEADQYFKDIIKQLSSTRRTDSTVFGVVNHSPISAITETTQTFRAGQIHNDMYAAFSSIGWKVAQAGNHMGGLVKFVLGNAQVSNETRNGVRRQMEDSIKTVEDAGSEIDELSRTASRILGGIGSIALSASTVLGRDTSSGLPDGQFIQIAYDMITQKDDKPTPLGLYVKFTREWSGGYMNPTT